MDRSRVSSISMMRARLAISGRVQGVNFRASARDEARTLRLAGWVRNRLEGDVEAVVEGEEGAVQAFIAWCQNGPPAAHVSAVQVAMEPYTGELHDFRVVG